jgi:hypothetical protein
MTTAAPRTPPPPPFAWSLVLPLATTRAGRGALNGALSRAAVSEETAGRLLMLARAAARRMLLTRHHMF